MRKFLVGAVTALAAIGMALSVGVAPAQADHRYFNVVESSTIEFGDMLRITGKIYTGGAGGVGKLQLKADGNASSGNWMTMRHFSVGPSGKFTTYKTAGVSGTWRVVYRGVASSTDHVSVYRLADHGQCLQRVVWDYPGDPWKCS